MTGIVAAAVVFLLFPPAAGGIAGKWLVTSIQVPVGVIVCLVLLVVLAWIGRGRGGGPRTG